VDQHISEYHIIQLFDALNNNNNKFITTSTIFEHQYLVYVYNIAVFPVIKVCTGGVVLKNIIK